MFTMCVSMRPSPATKYCLLGGETHTSPKNFCFLTKLISLSVCLVRGPSGPKARVSLFGKHRKPDLTRDDEGTEWAKLNSD